MIEQRADVRVVRRSRSRSKSRTITLLNRKVPFTKYNAFELHKNTNKVSNLSGETRDDDFKKHNLLSKRSDLEKARRNDITIKIKNEETFSPNFINSKKYS